MTCIGGLFLCISLGLVDFVLPFRVDEHFSYHVKFFWLNFD